MKKYIIYFKGIKFYNYPPSYLIKKITNEGGYLVAPAASSLATISKNRFYYQALRLSNIAILDSGFFCFLLRVFKQLKPKKLSGYLFLKKFISTHYVKNKKILLINPTSQEEKKNMKILKKNNFKKIYNYIAPEYFTNMAIIDVKLLNLINKIKPKFVLINIGGEKQELLAEYIYKKSNCRKMAVLCLGAAIAFLTKSQAPITARIDRYYLGWLARLWFNPKVYSPRLVKSVFLVRLFL